MNNKQSGGLGFAEAVQLSFIILRLTHQIEWKWIWVFSPSWISLLLILIIVFSLRAIELIRSRSRSLPFNIKILSDLGSSIRVEETCLYGKSYFPLTCMTDHKNRRYVRLKGRRYYI